MNKLFKSTFIVSMIIVCYGISFHYYNNSPHDWKAVAMWLPIYISPLWAISGASYLSERGKE